MSLMQGCELSNKISLINPKIKMVLITAYDNITKNDSKLEIVKKPITNHIMILIKKYIPTNLINRYTQLQFFISIIKNFRSISKMILSLLLLEDSKLCLYYTFSFHRKGER
jgi:two-component SAPR family response regulator